MSEDLKTGAPGFYDELFTEALAERAETQGLVKDLRSELVEKPQKFTLQIKQHLGALTGALVDTLDNKPAELWAAIEGMTRGVLSHLPEGQRSFFTLRAPPQLLEQLRTPDLRPESAGRKRPLLPLSSSHLLANRRSQQPLASIIASELRSADRVDIIMAFIRSSGVEVLREALQFAIDRGVPIRVLTSVYAQGSEARAIEALHAMGVELRIDLSRQTSNIHAKGWLFGRPNGYSTALIGSSNMSATALSSGSEWNLRVSEREVPQLITTFGDVFERAWESPNFVNFDPEAHSDQLHDSLRKDTFERLLHPLAPRIIARPHQVDALATLEIERETFGHNRNLLVSATGTGKTVTSALDYARLCTPGQPRPRLLYVAHRQEILRQARDTFRAVLGDQSFGELWVGEHEAQRHTHLFASIQLIARRGLTKLWPADAFDVVIIDEFHHAAADSYRALLDELQPQQVLGLTATPDRLDGQDITQFFDGRTAYSLRLWDALDDGLLTPFHYFGVSDSTDLRQLGWRRNQYDIDDLERALVGNDERMTLILAALDRYIDDPASMRALGFCISVAHARDMAEQFTAHGLPSVHLSGDSSQQERSDAIDRLVAGKIRAIFTVDLFNEGIDIPEVDAILFLRPTQSVTLFTQQLGRGLRLAEGKERCVVLDFIGQHRAEYGYENVYSVFSARGDAAYALNSNFSSLPNGCLVHLEPVALEHVLSKLRKTKTAIALSGQRELFDEDGLPLALPTVLAHEQITADEFYRTKAGGLAAEQHKLLHEKKEPLPDSLTSEQASLPFTDVPELLEPSKGAWELRVSALLHIDDDLRINALRNLGLLRHEQNHPLLNRMLLCRLAHTPALGHHQECLAMIKSSPLLQRELVNLADTLAHSQRRALAPFGPKSDAVLSIHAKYSRIEVTAALLSLSPKTGQVRVTREGVSYNRETNQDIFFVTINKDEERFNATVRYDDAVLSKSRLRWQSQNSASPETPTGQRYISQESQMLLFARSHGKISGVTQPFYFLGPVTPISHEGERPITFLFDLEHSMPQDIFHELQLHD